MPTPSFDISASLHDVVYTALRHGPQIVTQDGAEIAVLVSVEEWTKFKKQAHPSPVDVLLDPDGPRDLNIPPRGIFRLRPSKEFEDIGEVSFD